MLRNHKSHAQVWQIINCWNSNLEPQFITAIDHFIWFVTSVTHTHIRAHTPGRSADARWRSNASLPGQTQVFWLCTSACLGCCHWHCHSAASLTSGPLSVSRTIRLASISIYLDAPLTWIVQSFASHLKGLLACLLPSESISMFLPLQTPSTRPTEIGSQQGSWFMCHFTRKAWGCSSACPTILDRSCQVWRCRSSVSVKAYLHCAVKLSVVTTVCLLTFTCLWGSVVHPLMGFFFFRSR